MLHDVCVYLRAEASFCPLLFHEDLYYYLGSCVFVVISLSKLVRLLLIGAPFQQGGARSSSVGFRRNCVLQSCPEGTCTFSVRGPRRSTGLRVAIAKQPPQSGCEVELLGTLFGRASIGSTSTALFAED